MSIPASSLVFDDMMVKTAKILTVPNCGAAKQCCFAVDSRQ
jgi:hypothetical protein